MNVGEVSQDKAGASEEHFPDRFIFSTLQKCHQGDFMCVPWGSRVCRNEDNLLYQHWAVPGCPQAPGVPGCPSWSRTNAPNRFWWLQEAPGRLITQRRILLLLSPATKPEGREKWNKTTIISNKLSQIRLWGLNAD